MKLDGYEWMRTKWSTPVRRYWKLSEQMMVKHADLLICNSKKIEKYIQEIYGRYHSRTTFITYGSDTIPSVSSDDDEKYTSWLRDKEFQSNQYYFIVSQFVPETTLGS